MSDPFENPIQLVNWARGDISALNRIVVPVVRNDRLKRVVEVDQVTGNKTFKLVMEPTNLDEAARHATQAIIHLRHALDQALCACWQRLGLGDPPAHLYYPMADSWKHLQGLLASSHYEKLSEPVRVAIRAMHPYPQLPGEVGNVAYKALSQAAKNKHRIVCKIMGRVTSVAMHNGQFYKCLTPVGIPEWDIEKGEFVIGVTSPDGNIEVDLQFTLGITSIGAGPLDGHDLIPSLSAISNEVALGVNLLQRATSFGP